MHLAVIAGLLDDFWGHPVGGADEGVALGHGVSKLGSHPKVRQLYLPRLSQQYVAALYVPVHLQQQAQLHSDSTSAGACGSLNQTSAS